MIAKAEWFKRRKYTGWGLTPKDWRGWTYIAIVLGVFIGLQALPSWNSLTRAIITGAFLLFLFLDSTNAMLKMKKDERETLHEAKAERNSLYVIVIILSVGLAYQIARSAISQKVLVDWFIVAALVIGLIVKSISNIYYEKNN